MKKLWVILLAGCAFVMSQGFREVAAGDEEIPLSDLTGTYSTTGHGSEFLCFKDTAPFPLAKCGSPHSIGARLQLLTAGAATVDLKENCATFTATLSDLPVDISPPFVGVLHSVVKLISYDPATGTGDVSFTDYIGGKCKDSTFDKTGATVADTGTAHFTVSQDGDRQDSVVTSVNTPEGAIGDFSISTTALRH